MQGKTTQIYDTITKKLAKNFYENFFWGCYNYKTKERWTTNIIIVSFIEKTLIFLKVQR